MKITTLFICGSEICYSVEDWEISGGGGRQSGLASGTKVSIPGPGAESLHRQNDRSLIVAAASKTVVPRSVFLPDLPTFCWPTDLVVVAVSGRLAHRPSDHCPTNLQDPAGFRSRSFAICPVVLPSWRLKFPYVGWIGWGAVLSLEGLLVVIGNDRGVGWAMTFPRRRC